MGNSASIFCSPSSRPGEDDDDDENERERRQQQHVGRSVITKKQVSSLSMNSNLPIPKHLLWGCSTVEEHYEYIQQSLDLLSEKELHSQAGLTALGFEYRVVHGTRTCDCGINEVVLGGGGDDAEQQQEEETGVVRVSGNGKDDKVLKDDDDGEDDNDDEGGFFMDDDDDDNDGDGSSTDSERMIFDTTMVPVGISINEHLRLSQRSTTSSLQDEVNAVLAARQQQNNPPTSYFVNLKGGSNHDNNDYNRGGRRESRKSTNNNKNPKRMPKSMSSTSLFSLATHYSRSSTAASTSAESVYSTPSNMGDDDMDYPMLNHTCNTRLFHVPSNTMITERNFKDYIADGKYYDTVATLCMEYAQELMIQYGNLQEWNTTTHTNTTTATAESIGDDEIDDNSTTIRAFISKPLYSTHQGGNGEEEHNDPTNTATTTSTTTDASTAKGTATANTTTTTNNNATKTENNSTFLIVTGKGKVGAGIFSRRLLMTHGIEAASALFFIKQVALALTVHRSNHHDEHDAPPVSNIVLLDPNCLGPQKAMDVFETCCDKLVFRHHQHDDGDDNGTEKNDNGGAPNAVYVLAHSMAGSQLVRYLLRKSEQEQQHAGDENTNANRGEDDDQQQLQQQQQENIADRYLSQINSVAFTDSNHNINWVKKKLPNVCRFLQSPKCLYIKSHKVHEKQKYLGELHHDCEYWKHRFGTIKTIWAGTKEHALTNYTSRHHILDHLFDNDE